MAGYTEYDRHHRTDGIARRRPGGFGNYFQQVSSQSFGAKQSSTKQMVDVYTHNPLHLLQKNKETRQEAADPSNQLVLSTDRGLTIPRLHWYAYGGDLDKVQQCISEGDDTSVTITLTNSLRKDVFGVTPLILAAQRGHFEICQLLLQHGADLGSNLRAHGYTDCCDAAIMALANHHYKLWWYLLRQQARKSWSRMSRKNRNAHSLLQTYISGSNEDVAAAHTVRVPLMDQQPRELNPIHDDVYRPPALSAVLPEEQFREQYRSRTMGRTSSARMLASVAAAAAVAASNAAARLAVPMFIPPAIQDHREVEEDLLPLAREGSDSNSADTWSIGCSLREFYSGELQSPLRRHVGAGSGRHMLANDTEASASAPEHASLLIGMPAEDAGHYHDMSATRRANSALLSTARFSSMMQRMGSTALALPATAAMQSSQMLNWSAMFGTRTGDSSELDAPLMLSEEEMRSAVVLELLPPAPTAMVASGISPSPSMQTVIETSEDEIDSGRLLLA